MILLPPNLTWGTFYRFNCEVNISTKYIHIIQGTCFSINRQIEHENMWINNKHVYDFLFIFELKDGKCVWHKCTSNYISEKSMIGQVTPKRASNEFWFEFWIGIDWTVSSIKRPFYHLLYRSKGWQWWKWSDAILHLKRFEKTFLQFTYSILTKFIVA